MEYVIGTVIGYLIIICTILKLYLLLISKVCQSRKTLEGKTAIVTGANTGIGLETARDLAKRNAKVILACRNLEEAHKASEDIISTTGNRNVLVRHIDLSSLSSVQKFAKDIIENEARLDILVNNAGMVASPGKFITEDNLELQFATNYFGPFLLTNLLLPLLKKSAPSRIVIVSSLAYSFATLDLENLNCEKYVKHPYLTYADSKLANILFMRELSKKLAGNQVTVNALHPGIVNTSLPRSKSWLNTFVSGPFMYIFGISPINGAQTSIYLAVSEEMDNVSGHYYENCQKAWLLPKARDNALAEKLWVVTEKLTGLN